MPKLVYPIDITPSSINTRAKTAHPLHNANRVLFLIPKHIGDTLFLTPAFSQLHQYRPNLIVDAYVISTVAAETLANNPLFSNIIFATNQPLSAIYSNYDAIVSFLDDIPPSIDCFNGFWNDEAIDAGAPTKPHRTIEVCDRLALLFGYPLQTPGPYQLYPAKQHYDRAKQLLEELTIAHHTPLIGLHIGCSEVVRKWNRPLKRLRAQLRIKEVSDRVWPPRKFVKAIERIHQTQPNVHFILTGTPNENFIAKHFQHLPYVSSMIGKTSVLELAALMRQFQMMISTDSGPLHIACAMNIPLISIFRIRYLNHEPMPKSEYRVVLKANKVKKIKIDQLKHAFLELYAKNASPLG